MASDNKYPQVLIVTKCNKFFLGIQLHW